MLKPWWLVEKLASQWARASNERAIALARAASVECSRLAVERADVRLYLASLGEGPTYAAAT